MYTTGNRKTEIFERNQEIWTIGKNKVGLIIFYVWINPDNGVVMETTVIPFVTVQTTVSSILVLYRLAHSTRIFWQRRYRLLQRQDVVRCYDSLPLVSIYSTRLRIFRIISEFLEEQWSIMTRETRSMYQS